MDLILKFFKAKWIFVKPKPRKILIYDRQGSQHLLNYLKKNDCFIYDCRGESINIFILLKTIIGSGLNNLRDNYKKNYIKQINPKYIFTMVDNNPAFYFLKSINGATTVSIQNTYDRKVLPFQNIKKFNQKPEVDYMCVMSEQVGKQYSKNIKGNFITIGNIINNEFPNNLEVEKNSLTFISQFKPHRPFPKHEKIILKILKKFCFQKNLKLYVSSRVDPEDKDGLNQYIKILGNDSWKFVPKKSKYSSYERICKSEYIVFVSSSLGHEALARGKKTLSIAFGWDKDEWRKKHGIHAINPFGYLLNLPQEGPFWLNYFSKNKIYSKLNNLINFTDDEWNKIIEKYEIEKLFLYDFNNKKFNQLLNKLDLK